MHILILPAWLPTGDNASAGAFIIEQALALADDHRLKTGILYRAPSRVSQDALSRLEAAHIPVVWERGFRIPKANRTLIYLWCHRHLSLWRRYVQQYGKPDILHAHGYIAGFVARFLADKTGIPYVLTEHLTDFVTNTVRVSHRPTIHRTLDDAAAVIAVGPVLQKVLTQWTAREVLCIPNSIDTSIFRPSPIPPHHKRCHLIAIGALIRRKRIDLLLQAMPEVLQYNSNAQLMIVGTGPELQTLKLLTQRLGIDRHVTWHHYLPPVALAQVLQKADVLVSVSTVETFGVVIAEALACGVPVICTRSGGPEHFVTADQGILLHNDSNATDISNAIITLFENPNRYDPIRISDSATRRFGREVIVQQLYQVYTHILDSRESVGPNA